MLPIVKAPRPRIPSLAGTLARARACAVACALTCALTCAMALVPVLSGPAAAQSDIPADKRASIERLIALMDLDQMAVQTSAAMREQLVNAIRQGNPNFPDDAMDIVIDTFEEESKGFVANSFDEVPAIMAKYYTTDEIDQIIDFYDTPVGQKSLKVMPQLMQEIQAVILPRAQAFRQRVVNKIQSRLQDAGY